MLWEKNRKDPKSEGISPKDNGVVNLQFVAGVAASLIIGIALLMSGGVSPAVGAPPPKELEFMEVIEFEFMDVTEPEFMEVTKFEIAEVTDQEVLGPRVSSDGLTKWGGELKSIEYLMCAPLKGLPTPEKCLFEGQ